MSEAAKVPEHRIRKEKPTLRDMPVGETWTVWATAVRVIDGRCYLIPEETDREDGLLPRVHVHRNAAGYHVLVRDPATDFLVSTQRAEDLIPVATFTEAETL
jgi:hypothetical protein